MAGLTSAWPDARLERVEANGVDDQIPMASALVAMASHLFSPLNPSHVPARSHAAPRNVDTSLRRPLTGQNVLMTKP